MPLSPQNPLLSLEVRSVHHIDTENTLNLHGLWSLFSKCADTLQEGKRLENLSWRIYSRETFCCSPAHSSSLSSIRRSLSDRSLPELSSSFSSKASFDSEMETPSEFDSRFSCLSTSDGGRKHITPIDLENIVKSVTEAKELVPLSPLPPSLCPPSESIQSQNQTLQRETNLPDTTNTQPPKGNLIAESSTSTMATSGSQSSQLSNLTDDKALTEVSGTSVVRGFSKENVSRSRISRTQLTPPQVVVKPSPKPIPAITAPVPMNGPVLRKKPAAFMLGGSEGDESSPESLASRSFLAEGLRSSRKITSFKDEVQMIQDRFRRSKEAIDDSDDDPSESAIEDDDEWEDEPEASTQVNNGELFKRVDSSTNLTSRRSLITTMMHEKDRAAALQNTASRSTPAIRRRTSSHNGPLVSSSSNEHVQLSRARPINVGSSSSANEDGELPPSPRTNRRNMLSTELTGSLRKHILWMRQNKNPASKALKNRTFRSEIKLTDHVQEPYLGPSDTSLRRNETMNFYDNGLQEYFEKGW